MRELIALEQVVDELGSFVGRVAGQKRAGFLRRRQQTGQVEVDSPHEDLVAARRRGSVLQQP